MLRFHKSNACLSGKDALAAFFPGQTYATPAIQAAMRDCAARSALPLTILSGQYHQLRQVLRFMAEDEKSIGSGIALTHRREAAGLGARGTVSAAGEPDAVPKLRLVRPGIYSVLRRRPRKSLWSSDADETSFPAYRGGPVTEGAESGTLLFGDRSAGGAGHDVPGAGRPAELNGPSGAEKAYKRAIRKLKQHLHGGAYGRWLDIQRALQETRRDAEQETGYCTPQRTWREQKQS